MGRRELKNRTKKREVIVDRGCEKWYVTGQEEKKRPTKGCVFPEKKSEKKNKGLANGENEEEENEEDLRRKDK